MQQSFDEIRGARRGDESALVGLMAEHIEYERSTVDIAKHQVAAITALLSATHPARCLVAIKNGEPIGYATTSPEFSTWLGSNYLHMDTLYIAEASRGGGVGAALLAAVLADAQRRGYTEVQWQTPDWNTDAIRFYERIHASAQSKVRFSIAVEELPSSQGTPSGGLSQNSEVLDRFSRAWAQHDRMELAACLAVDCRYSASLSQSPGNPIVGLEAVLEEIVRMWKVDSDAVAAFGEIVESGDVIVRPWKYSFLAGPPVYGIDLFRFADGLIVEKDAYRKSSP